MLVVVKTPYTKIEIQGFIPPEILKALQNEYGNKLKMEAGPKELMINALETKEYKEFKRKSTPGRYIRIYRENAGLSQEALGKILGRSKTFVLDMEKDRKPVSKEIAAVLSKIFGLPASKFLARKKEPSASTRNRALQKRNRES